jgi:peptide-methionine (S)-S-oxide reductase
MSRPRSSWGPAQHSLAKMEQTGQFSGLMSNHPRPENRTMNRSLPNIAAVLAALTVVLVLVAATVTSGASRQLPEPVAAPFVDATVTSAAEDTAVFAGGCFWGIEAVFEHVKGVKSAVSGYAGGNAGNPSYEQVSTGDTGHAESVQVIYDPSQVSYGKLLQVFFSVAHDPTQLNRQGPDRGTQYRSEIFYNTPQQQHVAESYIKQLTAAKTFSRPIVTKVEKLRGFYPAEDYHQDYLAHHPNQPYIVINDQPKVAALKKQFPTEYRN